MFKFIYLTLLTFAFLVFILLNADSNSDWTTTVESRQTVLNTKFSGVIANGAKRDKIKGNWSTTLGRSTSSLSTTTQCRLPKLDPWDAKILPYLNPSGDLNREPCDPTFEVRSYFRDDTLSINMIKGEDCAFRCVVHIDDSTITFGNWTVFSDKHGERPSCDITEIMCFIGEKQTYHYAHVHLIEKRPKKPRPIPYHHPNAHDVYIVILDSVSASSFQRALSSTKKYLENKHDAIFFPYLNRVSLNSRPNGYGFLLNERADDLPESPWNEFRGHGKDIELCKKSLMDSDYIGKDFERAGYRSMVDTDWFLGLFEYPDCVGFGRMPSDHYPQPYQHLVDSGSRFSTENLTENVYKRSCKEPHHRVIETLKQFVNMYKDEPKFLITVFAQLGHDYLNNVFHGDKALLDMFMAIEKKLKNAFLILMSDHGLRFGGIKDTDIGQIEENNPMLMISLPKALRKNKIIIGTLKQNAAQHLSHYDLYATLLEIVRDGHKWDKNTEISGVFNVSDRVLKGSSLFHQLKQPRDCFSLQIPFDYCLCQYEQKKVQNRTLAIQIGRLMVEKMNIDVQGSNYSDKCSKLILNEKEGLLLDVLEPNDDKKRAYLVSFKVKPSGGKYKGYARFVASKLKLISHTFPRLDSYAKQAACIPREFLQNYCYCNDYKE